MLRSLQRSAGNDAVASLVARGPRGEGSKTPAIALDVLSSPGRSLDPPARERMEPRFGRSLDHVRIHTGPTATAAADAMGAAAYTDGKHIVLAEDFAPGSPKGDAALSHELSHVAQIDRAGAAVDPRSITPADHASEQQGSEAAPTGLALKRRTDSVSRAAPEAANVPSVRFREPSVVEGSAASGLDRRGILTAKRSATQSAALIRMDEIGRYTSEAIKDFWASADQRLGGNVSPYAAYAATTGSSSLGQLIRINLMNTPYPGGLAAPLAAGLPHTAVTLGALLLVALAVTAVVETNNDTRQVIAKSRELGDRVDRALSRAREGVKKGLSTALDAIFSDPASTAFLLDIEVDELVDTLGIPNDRGGLTYTPVRQALEESFAVWLALDRTPVRDFSLRDVRRARSAARTRANQGAAERGYDDEQP
jgi:hypothetical protein